jgi:hypothetical protein
VEKGMESETGKIRKNEWTQIEKKIENNER